LGDAGWYVQAGPSLVAPDGGDTDTEFSGKAGIGAPLTDDLSVYGEISFLTGDDDTNYGTKVGVKYSF
jgi:outer membrane autotransporter protein